jgi:hypothetical protein
MGLDGRRGGRLNQHVWKRSLSLLLLLISTCNELLSDFVTNQRVKLAHLILNVAKFHWLEFRFI